MQYTYMENIRIIKEKIRSCISCDENQCPKIKERLDHHVQSHHSSLKRSISQQITPSQKYSRILYPSRSTISDLKSDEQTSTSSLLDEKETENVNTSSYKEGLRAVVLEFVKNLRKNQNAKYSNREENIINEFIEKITKPSSDQTGDVHLDADIDEFLNAVPDNIDVNNEKNMTNLKENLANKITDFNSSNADKSKKQDKNVSIDKRKSIVKDKDTTTDAVSKAKSNKKDATVQSSNVDILINSISGTSDTLPQYNSNNVNEERKKSVDTQFPNVSGTFYANTVGIHLNKYGEETNEAKGRISNVTRTSSNWQERDTYYINHFEKNTGTGEEFNEIKGLIRKTIANNLIKYNFDIYSDIVTNEVIEFLKENVHLLYINTPEVEVKLFHIIKSVTDISDTIIDEIVNSIMNLLKSHIAKSTLNHYSSASDSEGKNYFGNILSVFKTEQNLPETSENHNPYRKKKSSILKKNKPNSEEQVYTDKLIALIKAWIDVLPKRQNKVNKKLKENLINNLVEDVLDQIKLEQVAPETKNEKEKFMSFFINRWLNKYEYFENISEAKSYVDQLIEKVKELPQPNLANAQSKVDKTNENVNTSNEIDLLGSEVLNGFNKNNDNNHTQKQMIEKNDYNSCCGGNLSQSIVSGDTIKDLIKIYFDHKYDSENFISRKACAELFKDELKKINNLSKIENNTCPSLQQQQAITLKELSKDLKYIKIITDWIKELPLEESFNKTQNVEAHLVIDVAKQLREINDDMQKTSSKTKYNNHIKAVLNEFAEQLPISTHLKNNIQEKIDDLTRNIIANDPTNCCSINCSVSQKNLTDYIEAYIRENDDEIFDDDLKLESCILRLFNEINNKTNTIVSVNDASVYNADTSTHNETIKHFSLAMDYAKEISCWLKNLPLLSITDTGTQNQLVLLINDLAEKVSNTENDSEIKDYITSWISKLPLDPNKEIVMPVIIQQIMNRIKRANRGNSLNEGDILAASQILDTGKSTGKVCEYPHSCCNKTITCEDNRDPATVILEYIEEWCNDLPVQADNEIMSRTLKENVASKLFQKFGELNMNPEYFKNNILYEEMFSEEIDSQIENLPQNPTLQNLKTELKKRLLNVVTEQRNKIKTKISGVEYKHDLEKTVEISLSNTIPNYKGDSPGFKMYSDRLATMFILENFDHGNDAAKLNYERRIRKQIDKYFHKIQDDTSLPLTKDEIYNELYSLLFSVPLPNESSMIEEVEEIKTKCEIDSWFESLPLREATGLGELLEWDQILAMLAKRLNEFEKYENDNDSKMHKEITKWLARLPILPKHVNEIDKFANDLQQRLRTTKSDRRHVPNRINKSQQSIIDHDKTMHNSNVTEGPRNSQVTLPLSLPTCCQPPPQKPKKPADMILDVVQTWCQQLPLPANTQQEKDNTKIIQDNLIIKIIMKISEMNMNPEIFNDDFLYDAVLDDELENLLSKLPASYEFIQSKNARKHQLKEAIKSIKHVIEEGKARYNYKTEIKNAVDKILKDPPETDAPKKIFFNSLKEEIVDSIIIYNFNKDDKENSLKYKTLVHEAVDRYFTLIDEDENVSTHTRRDSLLKGNQLLCEMSKVPTPEENVIQEEVQEIKIKFELTKFLNDIHFIDNREKVVLKNQIKTTLAKQLNCSIAAGDIIRNKNKIKEDVTRTLKRLDENIDFQKVDSLLNQIQCLMANEKHDNEDEQNITVQNDKANKGWGTENSKEENKEQQWMSLLPVTPPSKTHDDHNEFSETSNIRNAVDRVNTNELKNDFDRSLNESSITYETFEKGTLLSSSVIRNRDEKSKVNSYQQSTKLPPRTTTNQNIISPHTIDINKIADASLNQNETYNSFAKNRSLENRASAHNKSDYSQKSKMKSNQKSFYPSDITPINQNVNQDLIDQSNQTQYPEAQSHLDLTGPSPYPRGTVPFDMTADAQGHQETSSMSSQTPNLPRVSGFEQYKQNAQITANPFPANTQDASTQITERSLTPSLQSIPLEPSQFQNFREPSPYIPSTSTAAGRMSPGRLSPQKPVTRSCNRGQPCRRPSITIYKPTGLPRCNEFDEISPRCDTKIAEDDSEMCECLGKRKRPNICSAHLRRQCRICNEINPYCRLPPYRYPSFYYHRF